MPYLQRYSRLLVLTLLLLSTSTPGVAERHERLIDGWRPIHFEVSITFDEKLSQLLSARTEVTVQIEKDAVGLIDLDFGVMPVDSLSVGGKPASFVQKDGKLVVTLAQSAHEDELIKIAVDYHGRPKDGLIFTADKDGRSSGAERDRAHRRHCRRIRSHRRSSRAGRKRRRRSCR